MSARELRRAEVLGRVKGQTLRLVDAARMLEVSYRQAKRLWQRYREEGAKGLQHRSAGRSSNRAKPEKFRRKVLRLIREKYSGTEQERFGPTLAAEHLADEDGLEVGEETLRRWMLAEGLWSRMRRRKAHPISNDWVVPYRGHFLQLQPQNRHYGPTKAKALVCEWEDGAVEVHYRGECMDYKDLVVRPQAVSAGPSKPRHAPVRGVAGKPAQDHPWRQGYEQRMKLQKLNGSQVSTLVGESASATP